VTGPNVPERTWERRLELLKQMGCNAIRLSHNPPAPELLDLLDSMGFLVMDEAFDEWKQPKLQTPLYGYRKYFDEWAARDAADDVAHVTVQVLDAKGRIVPTRRRRRDYLRHSRCGPHTCCR
jgi:beta-galactosidase/beta-glucuronidase